MGEKETLLNIEESEIVNQEEKDAKSEKTRLFKIVRKVMNVCEQNLTRSQVKKLRDKYEILKTLPRLQSLDENIFQNGDSKKQFREAVREEMLLKFYEECQSDPENQIFFAAATFNLDRLREIVDYCNNETINKPRYSDSVMIFTLKYGNVSNKNFPECMNILMDSGADVNKPDFHGKVALEYVAELYQKNKNSEEIRNVLKNLTFKMLKKATLEFVSEQAKGIVKEMGVKIPNEPQSGLEIDKNRLFYWIASDQKQNFVRSARIVEFKDIDNGEDTLLQFATRRSANMESVVKCLLDKGANPNKTTDLNLLTPLEIAARKNHESIFRELLKNKSVIVTEEIFRRMVKWRSNPVKLKIFEIFLESGKLEPQFTYETTGNTPLHYAALFGHKAAIQKLLKQKGAPLLVENKFGKTVLDIIDPHDLETHFDSCIAMDNYVDDVTSLSYKLHFRFQTLITGEEGSEVDVILKLCENNQLTSLLTHPFIHTFIDLKWYRVKFCYWAIVILQAFLFLAISISFYFWSHSSIIALFFSILFTLVNVISKSALALQTLIKSRKFHPREPTSYELLEAVLSVTLLASFISSTCLAFAFIEMSIIFLLTVGFHRNIAKWSVMLQTVIKSFTILMAFFSIIMLAFAAAFHVLFRESTEKFFGTYPKSVFITYVMTTGEFNIDDVKFRHMAGYILFFLFAMFVFMAVVNFWTGVAVTDISKIEQNSERSAFENVIKFLVFVQKRFYGKIYVCCKYLPSPFLFSKEEKYEADFFINRDEPFNGKINFPRNVSKSCLNKIFLRRKIRVAVLRLIFCQG